MPDFLTDIKEKFQDLFDKFRYGDKSDYIRYALVGTGILCSIIAMTTSVGNLKTAKRLEAEALHYREGQDKINDVFGSNDDVAFSEQATKILGSSGLMLQYKDIGQTQATKNIKSMEKMIGVDSSAIDAENYDHDQAMYESIVSFAGQYGGMMVIPNGTNSPLIRMAAYNNKTSMTAPDDNTVMNILVKSFKRTIPSTVYGQSSTQNTLTIASGSDIRSFSGIKKGDTLYALIGQSTGTKSSKKYICTGIEEGSTLDAMTSDVEAPRQAIRLSPEIQVITAEPVADPEISTISGEDVSGSSSSSSSSSSNKTSSSSGSSNGSQTSGGQSGTNSNMDVIEGDSSSSTGSSNSSSSASDAASPDEGDGNIGVAGEVDLSSFEAICAADGSSLASNKTADLILYQVNSNTGAITISYWNVAGSDTAKSVLNEVTAMKEGRVEDTVDSSDSSTDTADSNIFDTLN